jgi:hypothetical protein
MAEKTFEGRWRATRVRYARRPHIPGNAGPDWDPGIRMEGDGAWDVGPEGSAPDGAPELTDTVPAAPRSTQRHTTDDLVVNTDAPVKMRQADHVNVHDHRDSGTWGPGWPQATATLGSGTATNTMAAEEPKKGILDRRWHNRRIPRAQLKGDRMPIFGLLKVMTPGTTPPQPGRYSSPFARGTRARQLRLSPSYRAPTGPPPEDATKRNADLDYRPAFDVWGL